MCTVIIPILWGEDQFQKAGFQKSKPLIDVLGKPMIEKFLEIFRSEQFHINFLFIVNETQLTEELTSILTKYGKIIKKQGDQDILYTILNNWSYINNDSKLIIANYSQYIDWNFDNFLNHCKKYKGCIVTFFSSDQCYNYLKINDKNFVQQLKYKSEVSNYAVSGIFFFLKAKDFFNLAYKIYNKKIKIYSIFNIDSVYQELLIHNNVSIYNISHNNLFLLNNPVEFYKYIQKLKQRYLK